MSEPPCPDPIHQRFGLSYACYLVLRRSILQSMPEDWQARFVALLEELDDATEDFDDPVDRFDVHAIDEGSRRIQDPYADYDRGRRRVPLKTKEANCST